MTNSYNTVHNITGSKESSALINKTFKLENALYQKIQEHDDDLHQQKQKPKKCKAVDKFLKRRERCDKFIKESIAPDREAIAQQQLEQEKAEQDKILGLQNEAKKLNSVKVEEIVIEPLKGEIKMAPMNGINEMNNSRCALPFNNSGDANSVWSSVKFGSKTPSVNNSMLSSLNTGSVATSTFSSDPLKFPSKSYKPVNYMNFRSKNVGWRDDGQHKRLTDTSDNVNYILQQVKDRETQEKAEMEKSTNIDETKPLGKVPNGVCSIGLSKVTLPEKTGVWRPSNDNWRPGVNTDGFFTALEELNKVKEENAGKRNTYNERSFTGNKGLAYKDDSLSAALKG